MDPNKVCPFEKKKKKKKKQSSSNCWGWKLIEDANSGAGFTAGFDPVASDTESVYSERSGYEQERRSVATFLQETTSKPKNNEQANALAPLKINARNKLSVDSPLSTPQAVSSSSRGTSFSPFRPASPSRRSATSSASSTPRGTPSPSRVRSGAINDYLSNGWSILSFGDEVRRVGKVVENRVVDAHTLRLMYNRYLQWRFFNARADVEIAYKKITREVHMQLLDFSHLWTFSLSSSSLVR